jgi:DNA modification methylase
MRINQVKFTVLTKQNFLMYAIKAYECPTAKSNDDFKKDMKAFPYIGKFLNRMKRLDNDEPKWRLLINHIINLLNIFRPVATTRMLLFYFPKLEDRAIILAILDGLKSTPAPEKIKEVDILEIKRDKRVEIYMRSL